MVSFTRDITERKRTEKELRKLSRAVEQSPATIVITDSDGKIEYVNPKFTQLTGYSSEEAIGTNPRILKSGKHPPEFYEHLWNTIISGDTWQGEFHNKKKNGELYWEFASISPITNEEGAITDFVCIKENITEKKRAEKALQTIAEGISGTIGDAFYNSMVKYLAEILEAEYSFVGELIPEHKDRIRTIAVHSHGKTMENFEYDLAGTPCENVVEQQFCFYEKDLQKQFPDDRMLADMEIESYAGSPLFNSDDQPIGIIVVLSTKIFKHPELAESLLRILAIRCAVEFERKQAEGEKYQLEQQLFQAQKMEAIGQLTGGIAHDFNNILASILGYSSLALDRPGASDDGKLRRYLEEVIHGGERAKNLVEQMLIFSRGGENETGPRPVTVADTVTETLRLLKETLPASVELDIDIEEALPPILIDPVQLEQIILNLCINARDAMAEVGTLGLGVRRVSIGEDEGHLLFPPLHETGKRMDVCYCRAQGKHAGDYIELSVTDTGHGIPGEMLDRIFEPFFTTKEVGKGTGMGLSMVHGIVQRAGGHIVVESEACKGTVFRLLFAALVKTGEGERPPVSVVHEEAKTNGGGRILVVDDEPAVLDYLGDLLGPWGLEVTVARNGMEALALFETEPEAFDVVVTDQTMPKLTGVMLAEALLTIRPDIPIILCTGYSSHVDEAKAREIGIRGFLMKPVESQRLLDMIQDLLSATT